jgi:ADP-heptose:LPS heptosyltransferase
MPNVLNRARDSIKRIVIFRALQLGDMLCSVPALRACRAFFPNAFITLVGLPWSWVFAQRFSLYLNDWIPFPGMPGLPEQTPRIKEIPGFLGRVQSLGYDLALQMHGSGEVTNPLLGLFGAHVSAGFIKTGIPRSILDIPIPYPEGQHEILRLLQLTESLGIPSQGTNLEFPVLPEELKAMEALRRAEGFEGRPYVCVHAGARDPARRWSLESFALVVQGLKKLGIEVVLTGSKDERGLIDSLAAISRVSCKWMVGLSLGELGALLKKASLLISNDTGVSHMAAALGIPSVIIFLSSDPKRWAPLESKRHRALIGTYRLTPQEVLSEAQKLLEHNPALCV